MLRIKIIFVCLGNYCRSPMAEAIFKELARSENILDHFDVTSKGTKNWDIGLRPDPRTQRILKKHNYPLDETKRAEKITPQEIQTADYLIAMSERVANELQSPENTQLLMSYVADTLSLDIPDPYPTDTFPEAFTLIERGVKAFYEAIKHLHDFN
jgi:protein-tyrosine phosphatase